MTRYIALFPIIQQIVNLIMNRILLIIAWQLSVAQAQAAGCAPLADFVFSGAVLDKLLVVPTVPGGGALDQIWTVADFGLNCIIDWQFSILHNDGTPVDASIVSVALTTGVISLNDDVASSQVYKLVAEYTDLLGVITTLEQTNIDFTVLASCPTSAIMTQFSPSYTSTAALNPDPAQHAIVAPIFATQYPGSCPSIILLFESDGSTPYSGNFVTVDATSKNLLVDLHQILDQTIIIEVDILGVQSTSGAITIQNKCVYPQKRMGGVSYTQNLTPDSNFVSVRSLVSSFKNFGNSTTCVPKMYLEKDGAAYTLLDRVRILDDNMVQMETNQIYGEELKLRICYNDCLIVYSPFYTLTFNVGCDTSFMSIAMTTSTANHSQIGTFWTPQEPFNFEVSTVTAPNMDKCALKKIRLTTTSTEDIAPIDFSPTQIDMLVNPAPYAFEMTNTGAAAAVYNFYIKVDFVGGTQVLQIGGIDQMQLTILDPCPGPPAQATTVSVPDQTPFILVVPIGIDPTPVLALSILTVFPRFVTAPPNCFMANYILLDAAGTQVSQADPLQLGGGPPQTEITAVTDKEILVAQYYLQGITVSGNSAQFPIVVSIMELCGSELLSYENESSKVFILQALEGSSLDVTFASMKSFFVNTRLDCPIEVFSLFDDITLTVPITDAVVTHDSTKLSIDQGSVGNGLFYGKYITKGSVSKLMEFEYHICGQDSLGLTFAGTLDEVYLTNQATEGMTDAVILVEKVTYQSWHSVSNCQACEGVTYTLLDSSGSPYQGGEVKISQATGDIEVSTAKQMQRTQYQLEISMKLPSCSSFIPAVRINIFVQVCGDEIVSTVGSETIYYNVMVEADTDPIVIRNEDIASQFRNSDPGCKVSTFISRAPTGAANLQMTSWSSFVSYDNSSDLVIDHHGNHGHSSNMTDFIYLRAVSLGNKEAYKTIQVNYVVDQEKEAQNGGFNPLTLDSLVEELDLKDEEDSNEGQPEEDDREPNEALDEEISEVESSTQSQTNEVEDSVDEETKPEISKTAEEFAPSINPGKIKKIDPKLFQELSRSIFKRPEGFVPNPEAVPVVLRIEEISRNGLLQVNFNQELIVPPFFDQPGSNKTKGLSGRHLVQFSEVEVSRDLMDITFVKNSDSEQVIVYHLEIWNWTSTGMAVQLHFTDPLLISKGQLKDQVICKILNKHLFRAKNSNLRLMSDRVYIQKPISKQLPHGVYEQDLQKQAETAAYGMTAMFVVQFLLQVCLKGILDDLWVLFFTLQIMCSLQIYDVPLPANAQIYVTKITEIIEFRILHPDTVGKLQTGDPDFKTTDFILQHKRDYENGQPLSRILEELSLFVFALIIFLLAMCIVLILMIRSQRARDLMKKLRDMIFFNMIIRSVTIIYITLCITFGQEVESFLKGQKDQLFADKLVGTVMFIIMFVYPVLSIFIVFYLKARLDQPEIYKRISNFYADIKLTRRMDSHLAYYTIFLIRRIIFVSIPTFMYKYPFYQVQILIFLTSLYIIFYAGSKPHIYKSRRWIEVFNEVWVMMMNYHLIIFTDFVRDNQSQFTAGRSFIYNMGFVVAVNIAVMLHKMVRKIIRKHQLRQMKKATLLMKVVDPETSEKNEKKKILLSQPIEMQPKLKHVAVVQSQNEAKLEKVSTKERPSFNLHQKVVAKPLNFKNKKRGKKSVKATKMDTISEESLKSDGPIQLSVRLNMVDQFREKRQIQSKPANFPFADVEQPSIQEPLKKNKRSKSSKKSKSNSRNKSSPKKKNKRADDQQ